MRLTADTDRDSVAAHVEGRDRRAALRMSEARADRLQRNARIRSGRWNLELSVDADHVPATIEPAAHSNAETADGTDVGASDTGPHIVVSGDLVTQPVTDYPPREWDLLVQKVRVMHEVGHLRHTDFADLHERLVAVPEGWQGVAGHLWNAFEDGAVEAAIRDRWPNYGDWFGQVRANLLRAEGPGIPDPRGGYVYPMSHAIVLGILDGIVYDSALYERLLDPTDQTHYFYDDADRQRFESDVREQLAGAVAAVRKMPDPVDRNQRALDFFETVRPVIEAATADGRAQIQARRGDFWGMPDDAAASVFFAEGTRKSESETEDGGDTDADPEPIAVLTEGPPRNESGRSDAQSHPSEPEIGELSVPGDGGTEDIETTQVEALAEEIHDQQRTVTEERDTRVRNLEELQEAVAAAEAELESDGVVLPTDDPEPDQATAAAAHEDGQRLARLLRNRFQKRRRRRLDRNKRRGRLDPAAIHRHALGETRLKLQRQTPEETDHHCLFVLDRSGSMTNHVRVAERAMGMLVVALEAVDVEVSVLELLDKEVRLAKPADREVGRAAERLFHGEATGGTPLTDTLHIARERLKRESGKRFLFVVTDGLPADPDRYSAALDRFPFPVIGVNLSTDRAAGTREFHRQVTVEPETDQLRRALRQLVQEVLFE